MMIKKKLSYKGCHDLLKKKRNEIDFKQQLEHLQRAFTQLMQNFMSILA